MKKITLIIIFFFSFVNIALCQFRATVTGFTYLKKDVKVDSLIVLSPITSIFSIKQSSEKVYDTLLSKDAYKTICEQLPNILADKFIFQTLNADTEHLKFIDSIYSKIKSVRDAKKVIINGGPIIKLLDSLGKNYALCLVETGFSRTEENWSKLYGQSQKREIVRVIAPNWYPIKCVTHFSAFIIDRKNQCLIYFKSNVESEKEPTSPITIKSQLHDLINWVYLQ